MDTINDNYSINMKETSISLYIEHFQSLFGSSNVASFLANKEGSIIARNELLNKLFNHSDISVSPSNESLSIFNTAAEWDSAKDVLANSKRSFQKEILVNNTAYHLRLILPLSANTDYVLGTIELIEHPGTSEIKHAYLNNIGEIFDKVPDYVYLKDIHGSIIYANKSLRSFLRRFDLVDVLETQQKINDEHEFFKNLFRYDSSILSGERKRKKYVERIVNNKSEEEYTIDFYKTEFTDKSNGARYLLGVGQNLNPFIKAEKKIRDNEANLNSIVESTQSFIFLIDNDYSYVYYNNAYKSSIQSLYGYAINHGDSSIDFLPPEKQKKWLGWYKKALKGDTLIQECVFDNNSDQYIFEATVNPIFNQSNKVTGISVFMKDITQRKNTEKA
ncbi:MAG: PAS domain S-box protein, partial [Bacteroidales bacterium]|nr:PAS domain S-box protein [Bacteroidales bacterium]